ncbi:MAG: ribosome-associated translation inhibitor RaiA, partial [Actinomycetota bacterium]|nr:ribosome-associated translation inhibitor RaiA [Actinomycetota bacterium]
IGEETTDQPMDLTFTGRGLAVTDEVRETAGHKLARLERMEPRTTRIDLEFIGEHYPSPEGVKRVQAALHIPRKTFRAHAEADDVPTAIDRVADKLERQLRDHHGKRRASVHRNPLESAHLNAQAADTDEEASDEGDL